MRLMMTMALSAAGLLSGCGAEAPVRNEASSERPETLSPGEYELAWTVVDIASTDKTTPATSLKPGAAAASTRACVAADHSIEPSALAEGSDECTINDPYVRNGRMSLQLKCTRPGKSGNVMQGVDGDFTADGFEATVRGSTSFSGDGDYNMTRKVTAKRVGDCAPKAA